MKEASLKQEIDDKVDIPSLPDYFCPLATFEVFASNLVYSQCKSLAVWHSMLHRCHFCGTTAMLP